VAHTIDNKDKLLQRVRRIRGQVEAIERALMGDRDCNEIMQLLAACKGAIGSLTAEVIEEHVRSHIADPNAATDRSRAAKELIGVLRTYLR
jgi:DNA-binding FrmR family transcriptional regulator